MAECSSEELARASTDRSNFYCLNRGEAIGLSVTVEAALLSLVAILFVFGIIVHNARWRMRHLPHESRKIFHQPMDILMASLLLADIVQAVGAALSLKWVQAGKVEVGTFCSAQGIVKIFGATGVALSTLAIAVYTFLGVWVNTEVVSMRFTLGVVGILWSFIGLLVTLAMGLNRNQNFNFMAPTPYWCWVNRYEVGNGWKMGVEYLWLLVALFLSFLIYIPLYLWMRGNLVIEESAWWRFHFTSSTDERTEKARRRKSLVMLAYPAVYCLCVLPQIAVRWKSFTRGHSTVPPAATFFASAIFALSGLLNAVLLLKTRPTSGLFGQLMFLRPARPPSLYEERDDNDMDTVDTGLGRLPPEFVAARR